MADYRAYAVGHDEHFVGSEPIVCDTDDQAIGRAKLLLDGRDIEVWCAVSVEMTSPMCPACNEPMKEDGRTFHCEPCRQIIMFFTVSSASPYLLAERPAQPEE